MAAGRQHRPGLSSGLALASVIATALILLGGAGTGGRAIGAPRPAAANRPLGVAFSSLQQQGRLLDWQVQLAQPFSSGSLAAADRGLCLEAEQTDGNGAELRTEACIGSESNGRAEIVTRYGSPSGPSHVIAAAITRSSVDELTAGFLPSELGLGYRSVRWQVISSDSSPGCVSARSHATCWVSWPASPRLLRLHTPRLVGCVARGPSEVFSGSSSKHELALTFDDGPWNDPPAIDFVNLLAGEHVPATFFEIGSEIPVYDANGSVERAMLADGDMIGDHTWIHPDMLALSPEQQRQQIQWTLDAIRARTGFTPCLWRPPYGYVNQQLIALARSMGLLTIMWDVDPDDWQLPGTPVIYQRVVSAAHDGAIVIQHFGGGPRYETLAALPEEIATLRSEGYRFVTVAQLLNLRLIYR